MSGRDHQRKRPFANGDWEGRILACTDRGQPPVEGMTSPCWLWIGASRIKGDYVSITADGKTRVAHRWVYEKMVGDDHISAQIDFASGATASLTCLSSIPYHGRFAIFGTRGWIEVKENANVDIGLPSDVVICDAQGKRTATSYASTNTVLKNFEAWARAVQGQGTYRFTREHLLDNIRVLEAIVRSAESGANPVML